MMGFEFGISKENVALRERGLKVSERFKNASEVAENGGTLTIIPPVIENGIYYGGLSKAINYNVDFQIQPEFTVSAWVYWDGNTTDEKIILSKGYDGVRTGIHFQLSSLGVPECFSYVSASYGVRSSAGAIPINTWTFLTATRAIASGWKIYVNGMDVSAPFSSTGAPQQPSNRFFCIGGLDTTGVGASSRWWYGQLRDVKVYSKALTPEEILAHYNGTMWSYDKDCVLFMNGLLHEYDPDNNQHIDKSIGRNNLQFGDGSTASTFPTKINGGYRSTGTQYLKTDNTAMLSGISELSVACLIKNVTFGVANKTIASKASLGAGNSWFLQVKTTFNDFQFRVYTGGSTFVTVATNNNYSEEELIFLTGVFDGSTIKLYHRNGIVSANLVGTINPTFTPIYIFQDGYGSILPSDVFECALYSTALNPTQILDLKHRMEAIYREGRQGR